MNPSNVYNCVLTVRKHLEKAVGIFVAMYAARSRYASISHKH